MELLSVKMKGKKIKNTVENEITGNWNVISQEY